MHLFHRWSKWQQYEEQYTVIAVNHRTGEKASWGDTADLWQRRVCRECDFEQRRFIASGPCHKLFPESKDDSD